VGGGGGGGGLPWFSAMMEAMARIGIMVVFEAIAFDLRFCEGVVDFVAIAVEIEFGAADYSLDDDSHRILYTSNNECKQTRKQLTLSSWTLGNNQHADLISKSWSPWCIRVSVLYTRIASPSP